MFERLQKPFLTVETGEAYQPIRLSYEISDTAALVNKLNAMSCLETRDKDTAWQWFWKDESDDLHFESLDSFKKPIDRPIRLGTFTLRENRLYLNLPSFKRACLAVPFFHTLLFPSVKVYRADFINKVFGLAERLPHGFAELFKEDELEHIVQERLHHYDEVQDQCEHAATAEEALSILTNYTQTEARKKLPFAERYAFTESMVETPDPDIAFLGFYIYLRGRELVAIRRWFGESGYNLADAAEETIENVFGGMNVDIIE